MKDKLRQAFGEVRADPALVARTQAFVAARTRPRRAVFFPRALAAAACLLLALAGGWWLYFVPTVRVSVDINPSLELAVNRFDHVIGVEGWNEDGEALAQALDLRFEGCTEAVEAILAQEQITALLADGGVLEITVVGPEGNVQCLRLLDSLKDCTAGHENARCHTARPEELEGAHEVGLSCGKYRAYLEIKALDPDITPEEIAGMTMREIADLLARLEGDDLSAQSQGQNGNGSGHGHHHGWE